MYPQFRQLSPCRSLLSAVPHSGQLSRSLLFTIVRLPSADAVSLLDLFESRAPLAYLSNPLLEELQAPCIAFARRLRFWVSVRAILVVLHGPCCIG